MKLRSKEKSAIGDASSNGFKGSSKMPQKPFFEEEKHPCEYISQDAFCETLFLSCNFKSEPSNVVVEIVEPIIDCDDSVVPTDDNDEEKLLETPETPRSTKSLLNVLGKDKGSQSAQRQLLLEEGLTNDNSENEASDDDDDDEIGGIKFGRKAPQFYIDISSPLGGKINKFCDATEFSNKSDHTEYCLYDKEHLDKRLRDRVNPPIFYKNKRKYNAFMHKYKFNKADKKEFFECLRTGIDKSSRKMREALKKFKVVLHDMDDSEIRKLKNHKKRIYLDPAFAKNFCASRSMSEMKKIIAVNPSVMQSLWLRQISYLSHNFSELPPSIYLNTAIRSTKRPDLRVDPSMKPIILPFSPSIMNGRFPSPQSFAHNYKNVNNIRPQQPRFNHHVTPSPQVQSMTKKGGSADDAIALSSDEEENVPSSSSKKNLVNSHNHNTNIKNRAGINQNHKSNHVDTSELWEAKQPARTIPAGLPAVHFTCHLCYSEIVCNIASTDYIKQHFSEKHNVTNIKVLQQRDPSGQVVLSIVESNPTPPVTQKPAIKNVPMHSSSQNSLRHSVPARSNGPPPLKPPQIRMPSKKHVQDKNYTSKEDDPEVICID